MEYWLTVLISAVGLFSIMICGLRFYFSYLLKPNTIEYYNDIAYL